MLEKAKQNRVILSMDTRYVVRLFFFFFYIENNVKLPQIYFKHEEKSTTPVIVLTGSNKLVIF